MTFRKFIRRGNRTEDTEVRNGGFGMTETMHDPEAGFQRQSGQTTPAWCHFEPTLTKPPCPVPLPVLSAIPLFF
jgi:hypothetical protein